MHGIAWNVKPHVIRAQTGLTANRIETVQASWRNLLKDFVIHVQRKLKAGGNGVIVEADEAVLRKESIDDSSVKWTGVVGVKARGQRQSLALVQTTATSKRRAAKGRAAPMKRPAAAAKKPAAVIRRPSAATRKPAGRLGWACPPPLDNKTWGEVASNHFAKESILSTDGALAYKAVDVGEKAKIAVNHSSKNGGPYFTKETEVDGKGVVAGTQSLDSIWGHLKKKLVGINAEKPQAIERALREGQWCHWIGVEDRFKAMGDVIKFCRDNKIFRA